MSDIHRIPALTDGSQKTQIVDESNNNIKSYDDVSGSKHLGVSAIQSVYASPENSSTANISGGATFTGTGISTLGVNGIQVSLKTDVDCKVFVEQSPDGTNWDLVNDYYFLAHDGGWGITVQAIQSYFRVRVQSLASVASTYFRLQSVLCPIVECLPRTLDEDGHLQVSIEGLNDHFGFQGQFTPIRDQKVCTTARLIGTLFGASNDANFWTLSNSGAGSSAAVANTIATIQSGTANSGYGQIKSVRDARFIFANPNLHRGIVRLTALSIANNTRRWGAFTVSAPNTPLDGFYFEVNQSNVLSVNHVSNGSVTKVSSGSFNGKFDEYVVDTNAHAYEIVYFVMGVWFYLDDILIHVFRPTTAVLTRNFNLPICATSVNSASGVLNGVLELWASSILRLGNEKTANASVYQSGTVAALVLKIGPGSLHSLNISGVANNSVITLYDNTAASGTIKWSSGAMAANTTPFDVVFGTGGIPFYIGLTLAITGANSNCTVVYE